MLHRICKAARLPRLSCRPSVLLHYKVSSCTAKRGLHATGNAAFSSHITQYSALCKQLADKFSVHWRAEVQQGEFGNCLVAEVTPNEQPQQLVLELPAQLVLSTQLAGCTPNLAARPHLQHVLDIVLEHDSWEVQIGFLLTWVLRQKAEDTPAAAFWRAYAVVLPQLEQHTCLVCWSEQELQHLKDPQLISEALEWQHTVHQAYQRLLHAAAWTPMPGAETQRDTSGTSHSGSDPALISSPGSTDSSCNSGVTAGLGGPDASGGASSNSQWVQGTPPAWEEFLWAVAAVQSRAFAFQVDGTEAVALLPFFDLANHSTGPNCTYTWDDEQQLFRLVWDTRGAPAVEAADTTPANAGRSRGSSTASTGEEVAGCTGEAAAQADWEPYPRRLESTISYGQKSNRKLMDQYGFVVSANPSDRLEFAGVELPHGGKRLMSHSAVRGAAERLAAAAAVGAASATAATAVGSDHEDVTVVHEADEKGGNQKHAQVTRLQCAAASVLAAAGWRRRAEYEAVTEATTREAGEALLNWVRSQLRQQQGGGGGGGGGAPGAQQDGLRRHRLEAASSYVRERQALLCEAERLLVEITRAT